MLPKLSGIKLSFAASAFYFYLEMDKDNLCRKRYKHIGRPEGVTHGINQKEKCWNWFQSSQGVITSDSADPSCPRYLLLICQIIAALQVTFHCPSLPPCLIN